VKVLLVPITLYSISDLNSSDNEIIKQNILEKNRCYFVDDDWWAAPVLENVREELIPRGFYDIDIKYSVSYSQGDGARITCKIPAYKALEFVSLDHQDTVTLRDSIPELPDVEISPISSRYLHENTMSVDILDCVDMDWGSSYYMLSKGVLQYIKNKSIELYAKLSWRMDELVSDDYILEQFNDLRYEFTADGKIYYQEDTRL